MYLGRAPRTKEALPDFREEMSGHPTFTSFRGLTGSQRTPGSGRHRVRKDLFCIMMPFIRIYVVFLCNMEKLIYTYRHLKL